MMKPLMLVGALTLSACGTLAHGTSQRVLITSSPSGAAVAVDSVAAGITPVVTRLSRRHEHTVSVCLDSAHVRNVRLTRYLSAWLVADVFVAVGLPLVVDLVNGGAYVLLPDSVHVALTDTDVPGDTSAGACVPARWSVAAVPRKSRMGLFERLSGEIGYDRQDIGFIGDGPHLFRNEATPNNGRGIHVGADYLLTSWLALTASAGLSVHERANAPDDYFTMRQNAIGVRLTLPDSMSPFPKAWFASVSAGSSAAAVSGYVRDYQFPNDLGPPSYCKCQWNGSTGALQKGSGMQYALRISRTLPRSPASLWAEFGEDYLHITQMARGDSVYHPAGRLPTIHLRHAALGLRVSVARQH